MFKRFAPAIALASALIAQPTLAQAPPPAPDQTVAEAAAPVEYARVAIVTGLGTITADLDMTNAPVTSANFLRYAKEKRFDGTQFYRVMRLEWGEQPNGLIQGGTQADAKRDLPPIEHEPTNVTGLTHGPGVLSMARYAPGTARGDFTIMLSNMNGLDARPTSENPDLQPGFAAFGHVVSGMDVARAIFDVPISTTKGQGVMKGQMIEDPVKILSVRRIERPSGDAAQGAREARPSP
jgi:peptidyl-prolyl cis-trans isomerase A (cyclophilin A)